MIEAALIHPWSITATTADASVSPLSAQVADQWSGSKASLGSCSSIKDDLETMVSLLEQITSQTIHAAAISTKTFSSPADTGSVLTLGTIKCGQVETGSGCDIFMGFCTSITS